MFQVNGRSLVGVSHYRAVRMLKSSGHDIVAVVSRPYDSAVSKPHLSHVAMPRPCPSFDPNATFPLSTSLSRCKVKLSQAAENQPIPSESLFSCLASSEASLSKLGDQKLPEKGFESNDHVTGVDRLAELSYCPSCCVKESSSVTARGLTWPQSLPPETAQQGDMKADLHQMSPVGRQDSQLQDKVSSC